MLRRPLDGSRILTTVWLIGLMGAPTIAQIDPRTTLLEQSAWKALESEQPESAAAAFREALATDPKNPRLHLGAAVAAFIQRRDIEARAFVDRALSLDPTLPAARELLGRLFYRAGDIDSAILAFKALVEEGGGGAALAETLDRWRRESDLHRGMYLAGRAGFTVAVDGPGDDALAQRALDSLERASTRIGAALSHYPTASIAVVLYTNEQFRDITRAPPWAGGAFDGIIRIPMRGALPDATEFDRVLAHEYTHALVYDLARGGVPTWLNEGLAVALERDQSPAPPTVAMPLGTLGQSFGKLGGTAARQAYAFSAFAVQRLLDAHGGFAMISLLRDLGSGANFETVFADRFQQPFGEFDVSLR